jgi:hypothetical protein
MEPIKLELDMEIAADKVETLTKDIKYFKRCIKLEKS